MIPDEEYLVSKGFVEDRNAVCALCEGVDDEALYCDICGGCAACCDNEEHCPHCGMSDWCCSCQ